MTPYSIFCAVIILMLGICGMMGNLLIIGAILLEKRLNNLGNVFIFNLAVVDLLVTVVAFPVIVANNIAGNVLSTLGCVITGAVATLGIMISALNIAAIAFERYIKVCCNSFYPRIYSKWLIAPHVILIWAIIGGALVPIFLRGEKSFVYDVRLKLCIAEVDSFPVHYMIVLSTLVLSCVLLCCFCYFRILQKVRESKRRICVGNTSQTQTYSKKDISLFKTMFTVFSVFLILTVPEALSIVLLSLHVSLPDEFFQWASYFFLCNSIVNGFIYGITNRQFRSGYIKCVNVILFRKLSDNIERSVEASVISQKH